MALLSRSFVIHFVFVICRSLIPQPPTRKVANGSNSPSMKNGNKPAVVDGKRKPASTIRKWEPDVSVFEFIDWNVLTNCQAFRFSILQWWFLAFIYYTYLLNYIYIHSFVNCNSSTVQEERIILKEVYTVVMCIAFLPLLHNVYTLTWTSKF